MGGKTRRIAAVLISLVKSSNRGNHAHMNRADTGKSDHSHGAGDDEGGPGETEE